MNFPNRTFAIDLHGDLTLELDGDTLRIHATGSQVEVDASSLRILRSAALTFPEQYGALDQLLNVTGLSVEVRLASVPLARFGFGVEPNWIARLSGLSIGEVSVSGLVRALLR